MEYNKSKGLKIAGLALAVVGFIVTRISDAIAEEQMHLTIKEEVASQIGALTGSDDGDDEDEES